MKEVERVLLKGEDNAKQDLRRQVELVRKAHGIEAQPDSSEAATLERIDYVEQAMVHRLKPASSRRTRKKQAVTAEERLAS